MRTRYAATLLTLGLLCAGCGGGGGASDDPSPGAAGSTATPSGGPSAAATGPASASVDPELGAAASQLAASAQAQVSSLPTGGAIAPRTEQVLGADISWPQCTPGLGIPHKISSGQPMPTAEAEYVVIGLTNGPGFHANPCLADQVAYARQAGLLTAAYAVASFPDDATVKAYAAQGPYEASDPDAALKNVGYQQAVFNVASMRNAGLESPLVWIDVEPVPYYDWSASTADNAAVVQGVAQGYLDAGLKIGVYSTPSLWQRVVGTLALGVPEWRAAGQTSMAEALNRCGPDWSIGGGLAVLGQWVEESRDRNVTCPGISADLASYFAPPAA